MTGSIQPRVAAADHFRRSGGVMGARIADHDWSATPLGAIAGWSPELVTSVGICLSCSSPTVIYWGPDHRMIFNDAWVAIPGGRGVEVLGEAAGAVWPAWSVIGRICAEAERTGTGSVTNDLRLTMRPHGHPVETFWNYSVTPIVAGDGRIAGLFNQGQETTQRVASLARAALLVDFGERVRRARSPQEVLAIGLELLGRHLGVARVGYSEIDEAAGLSRVERCWGDTDLADLTGTHSLEAFGGQMHRALARGEVFVIEDINSDDRFPPEVRAKFLSYGIVAAVVVPVLTRTGLVAGLFAHERRPCLWSESPIGTIRRMAERLWQEVTRTRSEIQLRDSEQRYRLIFEQAQDMIFTADLDQRITAANLTCAEAVDVPVADLIGRRLTDFLHPDDGDVTLAMLGQKLRHGGTTKYEVRLQRPGREAIRVEVNSTLATDADGRPSGLHGIARDITERRAFEDRQAALIDELNHRVKNTLALVQGLALQSFRADREASEAQDVFQHRLATLASAHDLLTRSRWEGAGFAELAATALGHYVDPDGRLTIAGPPVRLQPKAAVSLVLVLNELATNAAKYGAFSTPEGRITVAWGIADGRLTIDWREEGGPPARAPARRGFGLRMIERALANDLAAEVTMDFGEAGFRLTADAPQGKVQA
ncbi:HWE histidine kinase domain-containing protein [Sphingomonas naphthae]|uniref:histidine kinase n=1 Tax=Sphingomonas naphthae TaxID=1813468 RepID=A0ABY7TMY9_9SPHN|nr:HWE histidine kinase domain-containing protein [Sphingomonas naphthae]WCT74554.1 HWE histidine kinase domain-containing protein [Sphingomonas naphthae]